MPVGQQWRNDSMCSLQRLLITMFLSRFIVPCGAIQEDLLFLPLIELGRDTLLERHLRPIMAEADWRKQRRLWKALARPVPGLLT